MEEIPLVRIAEALESIAKNLEKIANPPIVAKNAISLGANVLPGEFTHVG